MGVSADQSGRIDIIGVTTWCLHGCMEHVNRCKDVSVDSVISALVSSFSFKTLTNVV